MQRWCAVGIVMFQLAAGGAARAQTMVTAAEYARAEEFMGWHAQKLVSGTQVNPRWVGGDRFWYRNRVHDGHEFVLVDPARRSRQPAFDHARLAAALSVAADTSYVPGKLPFREFEFVDGSAIRFHVTDSLRWTCDIASYECVGPDSIPRRPVHERTSPDGRWVAFEREENLWIRSTETGEEVQLSTDGETDYGYAVVPEGCCQEITTRRSGNRLAPVLSWSPDSRRIATHRYDERHVEDLHVLETALGRPKLHSYAYPLPGDTIVPMFDLHVFDVESRQHLRIDDPPQPGDFTAGDTLWNSVSWQQDGSRLYFTRRSRDFKHVELLVAEASSGTTRRILEERGPTLREQNLIIGSRPNWRVIGNGSEILWFSERDGWGHLYLHDATTGALKRQVTAGPWMVLNVLHVDEAARFVYVSAVGREPDRDPYYRHLYRVSLDRPSVELLSPEDADHSITVSPGRRYFVDSYSRPDAAPVTVVRDMEGGVVQTVEVGDISRLLAAGWRPPTPFKAKGRDGVTDVYGYLYFPSDFDSTKTYPVIDYVYPGPQIGPIGLRGFSLGGWAGQHALPELGFIVFSVDAMGTPFRAKSFHDAYYGNMGDNGLPDHISALRSLARQYPQMDLDRVGIFGHSGGGFASTDAILRYPDFFKVAVSSAGNHDNRGYYHAWAERYHGQLERDSIRGGDNYDSQANQNLAANLKGKLLLSYGTLDDNVHPNMTLLVVQELIAHNKDFDMFVMPNRNHGYAGEPYSIRRTWDYFVEHLLGAEPPREYELSGPPN